MQSNIPKFKIIKIFYSFQGEGFFAGKSAIFIRFTGCNLDCFFCDEPSYKLPGEEYSDHQLLDEIKKYDPCRFVVLTGGEPTIQPDFSLFVEMLQRENYFVAIETNGTTRFTCQPDWVTVSPKTDSFINGDELKIVYQEQDLKKLELLPFKHFYLQPLNFQNEVDLKSVKKCLDAIKEHPKWKLSIQIHKLLNMVEDKQAVIL